MGELAYRAPSDRARILDAVAQVEDVETLWRALQAEPDRQIRDRLILTYAPLVKYVAGKLGAGLPRTSTRATSSPTACSG